MSSSSNLNKLRVKDVKPGSGDSESDRDACEASLRVDRVGLEVAWVDVAEERSVLAAEDTRYEVLCDFLPGTSSSLGVSAELGASSWEPSATPFRTLPKFKFLSTMSTPNSFAFSVQKCPIFLKAALARLSSPLNLLLSSTNCLTVFRNF
jgi:hypothetical protein